MSLVLAAILLIIVTVAVSIAIAWWMGAFDERFTVNTEFPEAGTIRLTIHNNKRSSTNITEVWVNNDNMTAYVKPTIPVTMGDWGNLTLEVTCAWISNTTYNIGLRTEDGVLFDCPAVAP